MKTQVKRRPFGNTGLLVSEVGFGAMNLRMLNTREEGIALVNYVLDQGVNLIDTARGYKGVNGSGEEVQSEDMVGTAIEGRADIDEPIVIVTKGHGYTPETFDEDLQESLKTLKIKKTDKGLFIGQTEVKLVNFFHGIKEDRWETMTKSGVIEHARKRQAEGLFTYLGFSSHYGDVKEIKAALDTNAFQVMELPYNVYNRSIGEDGKIDLLKYAHDKGVAIVNMKAFNGNSMVATAKLISDLCSIRYSDMLRFCLSNPNISTVDAGARFVEEFQADIQAALLPAMTDEERTTLKKEADKISGLFQNICRECMHCLEKFECPQGIDFPSILGNHSRFKIAETLGKDSAPYIKNYREMQGLKADSCVGCGGCVEWCEYHLDIPAMMIRAREDLE